MNRHRKSSMLFVLLVCCSALVNASEEQKRLWEQEQEFPQEFSQQAGIDRYQQLENDHQRELEKIRRSISRKTICCKTLMAVPTVFLFFAAIGSVVWTGHCK